MYRKLACLAAVLAAIVMMTPAAEAGSRKVNPTVKAVAIGVGAASTAAYFAINDWDWKWHASSISRAGAWAATTVGCAAVSPMVATALLKRPLKYREAHILMGSCVVPIVGGWLVNEAYESGLFTAPDEKPVRKKKRYARK